LLILSRWDAQAELHVTVCGLELVLLPVLLPRLLEAIGRFLGAPAAWVCPPRTLDLDDGRQVFAYFCS
jgi:hypothetical protein